MTMRMLMASLSMLAMFVTVPSAGHAQEARADVLAAIDGFLQGLRTKDTTAMQQYVDEATRFTLLRPAQSGGVRVVVVTAQDFMTSVSRPEQPALDEPIRNPVVQIDGDLASVWAEYQVRSAGTVSHCGYDAFHLVRLNGAWKILNVSDTFRRTGCGEAW